MYNMCPFLFYLPRPCIHNSLESGKSSSCPECGFPAWARDVKPNHQLENVIRLLGTMRELVEGRSLPQTAVACPAGEGEEQA